MRELDFLPEWYRAGRRGKQRRQRQCVLFGVVVALLAGWSFIVGQSVSGLQAETRYMEETLEKGQETIQTALRMETEIARLARQVDTLDALTPRTPLTAVLSELAACVTDNMMLSRVVMTQEPIAEARPSSTAKSAGAVRIGPAQDTSAEKETNLPRRLRLTITGLAAGGGDVARLIERLESSDYFKRISPGFSRSKTVGGQTVTEFEIACEVADYRMQK